MLKKLSTAVALSITALAPALATVSQGSYTAIAGNHVVSFDELITNVDITNPTSANKAVDGIVYSQGVAIAERFAGQVLSRAGDFDILAGTPAQPLRLVAGVPGENLYAALYRVTVVAGALSFNSILAGVAAKGSSDVSGVGEGALSVLFSSDQSQIGLQVIGMDGGSLNLAFFRLDGSLINTLTVRAADKSYLGFFSSGGVKEIRGFSMWNSDPNGMSINDLKHDVASTLSAVPEPSQWALLAAGLLAVGGLARRRQVSQA